MAARRCYPGVEPGRGREDEKEMEEEGNSDSDISVSSDLGPIFNVIL